MALSKDTVWEVRTTGNNNNGGGFVTGASGTDWSQQDAAQYAVTDAVTNGTTTITSASASFGTDVVGNILYIQGGTGSIVAGWYEIVSRTDASTIVVDRSTGLTTGTGATLNIGGAFAHLSRLPVMVAGNKAWVKAGTYTFTATVQFSNAGDLTNGRIKVEGYSSTRGDRAGRPLLTTSTNSVNLITVTGAYTDFYHLKFTNTASTRGIGLNYTFGTGIGVDLLFDGCSNGVVTPASGLAMYFIRCSAINCTGSGFATGNSTSVVWYGCEAIDNGGYGFSGTSGGGSPQWYDCVAANNASGGFATGNSSHSFSAIWQGCTAANNGGDGFYCRGTTTVGGIRFINNIAYGNSGYGLNLGSSTGIDTQPERDGVVLLRGFNAMGSNTSGNYNFTDIADPTDIALTADPFVNSGSGVRDYSPNNTAGGGAAIRGQAGPRSFPSGYNTSRRDTGALQHVDPSGGSNKGLRILGG